MTTDNTKRVCPPCQHHELQHCADAGPSCFKSGAECHDGQNGEDLPKICPDYVAVKLCEDCKHEDSSIDSGPCLRCMDDKERRMWEANE